MQYFRQLIFLVFPICLFSQDFSNQWTAHYSFFQITDTYATDNRVYAATENAIFIYDTDTRTNEIFSTIDGLSGETISTVYHSSVFDITAIGYESGLLEFIVNDEVRTFIDIVETPTIPPTQKNINHFFRVFSEKMMMDSILLLLRAPQDRFGLCYKIWRFWQPETFLPYLLSLLLHEFVCTWQDIFNTVVDNMHFFCFFPSCLAAEWSKAT